MLVDVEHLGDDLTALELVAQVLRIRPADLDDKLVAGEEANRLRRARLERRGPEVTAGPLLARLPHDKPTHHRDGLGGTARKQVLLAMLGEADVLLPFELIVSSANEVLTHSKS